MSSATSPDGGCVLVVDDSAINRRLLRRILEDQGYTVTAAENGRQALDLLAPPLLFDVVLLDILMPELDGYETLKQIKATPALRHIPVIVISAVEEMDSVIRCIELGATDYLPKPFSAALLRARVGASLAAKRLRDMELEYLEQVTRVTEAAVALEAGTFDAMHLEIVATRPDALGRLARVFQRMAREVRIREERLERQVRELRIEIDQAHQAKKVAEVTGSEYFRELRRQSGDLRRLIVGS